MPLYSTMTRSAPAALSQAERFSGVSSLSSSTALSFTRLPENSSGSYSSMPSSQTSSSVGSPLLKRLSSSVSCMNFVFPASRKPVKR